MLQNPHSQNTVIESVFLQIWLM